MQLVKYNQACKAIAEAKAVDEVKSIHDKAEAMRAYAHQAKNKELEIDAGEIRMRAERRLGELIRQQKDTVGLNKGSLLRGSEKEPRDNRPTLAAAGIDKKLSSRAQKLAAVPEKKFEGMLGEWRDRVQQENERVTVNLLREGERTIKKERKAAPIPEGKFSVIYADPPWRYEHVETENRAIENQYPTMTLTEICEMPLSNLSADDCVLFLWSTSPKLAEAMQVLNAWKFNYRTCAVWDKEKIGMGYYFRQQHELLLIATRGEPGTPETSQRIGSVIRAPRGKHSEKPEKFYQIIEAMYPNAKRLELFARDQREGWTSWGNEIENAA